jgi:hypothetical protein
MLTDTPGGGQNWTPMVGHFSMLFDKKKRTCLITKVLVVANYGGGNSANYFNKLRTSEEEK